MVFLNAHPSLSQSSCHDCKSFSKLPPPKALHAMVVLNAPPSLSQSSCHDCKSWNIDEADARLRTDKGAGRPVAMPKKSAWSTMEAIRSKVAKKAADRKRKADERKELAWELFRKGLKPDATEAPLLEGQARDVAMGKLVKRFESDGFRKTFAALVAVESNLVTLSEARKFNVVHIVDALKSHRALPMAELAERILRRWRS